MPGRIRAIVLGARTPAGSAACRALAAVPGLEVVAAGRREPRVAGCDGMAIDLSEPGAGEALARSGATAIVSCAPLWVAAPAIREAAERSGARVAACSSMSAEAKSRSIDPAERAVADALRRAEDLLRASPAWERTTVLRPTMIWGDGTDSNVGALARFARRRGFLPCPGGRTGLRQPVHLEDVAACLAAAVADGARGVPAEAKGGRVVPVAGSERLEAGELVRRVAAAERVPCLTIPAAAWRALGSRAAVSARLPLAGAFSRLAADQVADTEEMRALLGREPRGFDPASAGR